MKFLKFGALLLLLFNFSCGPKSDAEIDQMYDQLIKDHDEVMPKTMKISSTIENLKKATETSAEEQKAQISEIIAKLNTAEDQMNDWMTRLGEAINGHEENKLETYKLLSKEIKQIKTDTEEALESAAKIPVPANE